MSGDQRTPLTDSDLDAVIAKLRSATRTLGEPNRITQIELLLRAIKSNRLKPSGMLWLQQRDLDDIRAVDMMDMIDRSMITYDAENRKVTLTDFGRRVALIDAEVWLGRRSGTPQFGKVPDPEYAPGVRGRLIDIE